MGGSSLFEWVQRMRGRAARCAGGRADSRPGGGEPRRRRSCRVEGGGRGHTGRLSEGKRRVRYKERRASAAAPRVSCRKICMRGAAPPPRCGAHVPAPAARGGDSPVLAVVCGRGGGGRGGGACVSGGGDCAPRAPVGGRDQAGSSSTWPTTGLRARSQAAWRMGWARAGTAERARGAAPASSSSRAHLGSLTHRLQCRTHCTCPAHMPGRPSGDRGRRRGGGRVLGGDNPARWGARVSLPLCPGAPPPSPPHSRGTLCTSRGRRSRGSSWQGVSTADGVAGLGGSGCSWAGLAGQGGAGPLQGVLNNRQTQRAGP